jgi:competence protein ComEC
MSQFSDKLQSAPFIRLLVPFIAGILLGDRFPPELKWLFLATALGFSFLLIFFITITFKGRSLFGILLLPALFFLGLFIVTDRKYLPKELPKGEYFGVIDEYPIEKEKSFRAVIRLIEPKLKVLAYFDKTDFNNDIDPGTVVWFRGQPELLRKTGNPFEFDYQAYAIRNKIGHRIYLKSSDFHFLLADKIPDLAEYSLIIRDRLLQIIEKSGLTGEVLHLVSAVSLGAREELEPETTQSFSKTGVIHVLAVSGMNVGIIYVVLDVLLKFLKRKKSGIILHLVIILLAVWGYALITGLPASVLRAAAMFSFIVIGKSLSRNPNIYNTLAASAFVLLCFNPSLVYDVGFQLSYAAVFSIVFFHPFIYSLCYFKYWIPDQIWALLTVSFAAQIGTLPFLLHYFHQFPAWFLLANLMVIPLVTLILYLSFMVFAVAPVIPFLGMLMAHVLDWAGQGMLFSVRFVERLPYSVIDGLYPSDLTLITAVLFAIMVSLFIIYKSREALTGALFSVIILLIFSNISLWKKLSRHEVVLFNLSGKTLIALTAGSETIWLTSDSRGSIEKLKYYTKPYEGFRGINKSSIICLSDPPIQTANTILYHNNFLNFKGFTLCILNDRKIKENSWENFPQSDLFVLGKESKFIPSVLRKYFPNAIIVENRPSKDDSTLPENSIIALSIEKFLNVTSGAVQITFRTRNGVLNNAFDSGYFNQKQKNQSY